MRDVANLAQGESVTPQPVANNENFAAHFTPQNYHADEEERRTGCDRVCDERPAKGERSCRTPHSQKHSEEADYSSRQEHPPHLSTVSILLPEALPERAPEPACGGATWMSLAPSFAIGHQSTCGTRSVLCAAKPWNHQAQRHEDNTDAEDDGGDPRSEVEVALRSPARRRISEPPFDPQGRNRFTTASTSPALPIVTRSRQLGIHKVRAMMPTTFLQPPTVSSDRHR